MQSDGPSIAFHSHVLAYTHDGRSADAFCDTLPACADNCPTSSTSACLQEQRERARQRASRFGTTDTLDAKVESLRHAQGERQRKRDRAERFNMEVEAEDETGQEDAGLLFRGVRRRDHGVEGRDPAAYCAVVGEGAGAAGCGAGHGRGQGHASQAISGLSSGVPIGFPDAQRGGGDTASHRGSHMPAFFV